ncbi:MAG: epoxyqueuosine reductase QueH [Clostridia bacterium]
MRLLLHMCCAPCALYPAGVLQDEKIEFEGFFYNPNIHPIDEFNRRKENVEIFSKNKGIKTTYADDFLQNDWENFSESDDERCKMCYSLRLSKTARFAKENGFNAFSTTLLVSPYQKHDLIKELGEKFSKDFGIEFYYRDFRPGFREGQARAKELGLYRQKYCGCIKSLNRQRIFN